jgi:uncharacterized protein YjiS (DUF1127 family)
MPHSMTFHFPSVHQPAIRPVVAAAWHRLHIAFRVYSTRQALPNLTARELADIGITSSAALAEAARLPWDAGPVPRQHRGGLLSALERAMEHVRAGHLNHDRSRLSPQRSSLLIQPYV